MAFNPCKMESNQLAKADAEAGARRASKACGGGCLLTKRLSVGHVQS